MNKTKKLMIECELRNLHCSITYQKINDYSIEIYTGYKKSYHQIFYTDGHIKLKAAVKQALKYLGVKSSKKVLTQRVRRRLVVKFDYDFGSEFWTDEMVTIMEEIVEATRYSCLESTRNLKDAYVSFGKFAKNYKSGPNVESAFDKWIKE